MTDTKLAERIEALEGPCRAMDAEITLAVHDCCKPHTPTAEGPRYPLENKYGSPFFPQPYTSSLDAAMTLVPEGWVWSINQFPDKASAYCVSEGEVMARPRKQYQATPALALCAAALRAQEAHNG